MTGQRATEPKNWSETQRLYATRSERQPAVAVSDEGTGGEGHVQSVEDRHNAGGETCHQPCSTNMSAHAVLLLPFSNYRHCYFLVRFDNSSYLFFYKNIFYDFYD
jgi:hypothetical protein